MPGKPPRTGQDGKRPALFLVSDVTFTVRFAYSASRFSYHMPKKTGADAAGLPILRVDALPTLIVPIPRGTFSMASPRLPNVDNVRSPGAIMESIQSLVSSQSPIGGNNFDAWTREHYKRAQADPEILFDTREIL